MSITELLQKRIIKSIIKLHFSTSYFSKFQSL